jgi:hypothetical protein
MPVTFLRRHLPICGKQALKCLNCDDNYIDRVVASLAIKLLQARCLILFSSSHHADRANGTIFDEATLICCLIMLLLDLGLSFCSAERLEEKDCSSPP